MKKAIVSAMVLAACCAAPAMAHKKGDIILRAGAAMVDPSGDAGTDVNSILGPLPGAVEVDSDTQIGLTGTYMLTDRWGIGLLAATPFHHEITGTSRLTGTLATLGATGNDIGSTKHLPPTVTVQYFFDTGSSPWQPYVGLGVNYTTFFSEDVNGDVEAAIGAASLDLDDSWGLAAQAGVDYDLGNNWLLNASVWYIDIDTHAKIQAKNNPIWVETDAHLDPMVWMVGVGYRF